MSVGQWSSSVDCWLAFFFLSRVFFRRRALEARCSRICALVWAGTAEKVLRVGLGVGEGGPQVGPRVVLPLVEVNLEASG
jgi:hypothetical protein